MTLDPKLLASVRKSFPSGPAAITLGAVCHDGECDPEPIVTMPIGMMNRHGLIAGATGTGKTKSLQLMAEQLARAGVPVFLADVKGDVSGIATPGERSDKVAQRAKDTGYDRKPAGFPVDYLSLT